MKVYEPEDTSDELYQRYLQWGLDAYEEGKLAGQRGYGAGMCPKDFSDAEVAAWLDGHGDGAAEHINERRTAAVVMADNGDLNHIVLVEVANDNDDYFVVVFPHYRATLS